MKKHTSVASDVKAELTIGVDLGDRYSHFCVLDASGEVVEDGRVATSPAGLSRRFGSYPPARVALEVGTHSPWVSRLLGEMGHEVLVADARKLRAIYANEMKSDSVDAQMLARIARLDPQLLSPIRHRGRTVGAYLGLTPRRDQSGDRDPQLRITKSGDRDLRRLLVQAAQYILAPFAPDTTLRRWGLALARRGGKQAKRRAAVAVARKLAVLLHRLWVTGEVYEPLRNAGPEPNARRAVA